MAMDNKALRERYEYNETTERRNKAAARDKNQKSSS